MSQISQETEAEAVIRLARRDTIESIATDLDIAVQTVHNIKKRNSEVLATIQEKLLSKKQETASRLVDKANQVIEQRLDDTISYDEKLMEIQADYEESEKTELDKEIYTQKVKELRKLSVSELLSVSREAHAQSQVSPEKDSKAPGKGNKAELDLLIEAINSGDEVKLREMVFNPKND